MRLFALSISALALLGCLALLLARRTWCHRDTPPAPADHDIRQAAAQSVTDAVHQAVAQSVPDAVKRHGGPHEPIPH